MTDLKSANHKAPDDYGGQPYDVLIVGAGILGCAAAVTLARQGRSVVLLERNLNEPDRIVGELLQPGGVAALEKLAMGECLEGIDAIPVRGYRVFYRGESITFWYPPVAVQEDCADRERGGKREGSGGGGSLEEVAGPGRMKKRPEGRSFHHGKFVMKLREMARREQNVKVVEATAKELLKREGSGQLLGVECLTGEKKETQRYFAHLTIIADGQASNFRSQCIKHTPIAKSKFWGLELIDADLPNYGLAYGVIGQGPPILIYQIGMHETRILIDIPNSVYEASSKTGGVKGYIRTDVIPTLPKSVQPMVATALKEGRLRPMPNSWLPPSMNRTPGMILLGDAMNMRHPLTGGGMTVALNDVVLLRQLLSPQNVPSLSDTEAVLTQMRVFHWKRKEFNASLNILAQALYCLFVADDPQLQVLRRGFVRYIQRGGNCVEEPAGLMGGVIHSPWLLIYHFLAVALYSLWILLYESYAESVWGLPRAIVECMRVFAKACQVIVPFILSEFWT